MAPSTAFARAALRPFSAPSSQLVLSSASASSSTAAARRMTTACRPLAARASTAAKAPSPSARAFSSSSFAAFSSSPSASILAATFRRTAHRAGSKGSKGSKGSSGRRYQSSSAGADAGAEAGAKPNIFKRLWDSPIGIRTVHFWAPVLKWALVLAGISDLARPAEKLSATQNAALTATGLIWTRWCLIIKPKNYMLAAVNFFLGIVGVVQCTRIFLYRQSIKGTEGAAPAAPAEKQ